MEGRLIQKSLEDESFRQRLLEDPRSVVEEDLGSRLPEGIEVRAVEETANTIYLVLPLPTSLAALGYKTGQAMLLRSFVRPVLGQFPATTPRRYTPAR